MTIPNIHKYPDLRRRLDYELNKLGRDCRGCGQASLIQRYTKLVNEREKQAPQVATGHSNLRRLTT